MLPDCNELSYDLVNSNMLLIDIYAPKKFVTSEIQLSINDGKKVNEAVKDTSAFPDSR